MGKRRRKIHYIAGPMYVHRPRRVPITVWIAKEGLQLALVRRGNWSIAKLFKWDELVTRIQIPRGRG